MRLLHRILLLAALSLICSGAWQRARAVCRQCTGSFACVATSEGAHVCLGLGTTCTMAGACYSSPHRDDGGLDDPRDPGGEAVTTITVLEQASPALGSTGVRLDRGMGEDLAADAAARAWAKRTGEPMRATLLAGLMHGCGVPIALRTREGDGIVLDRRDTRRGIKLVVRSMFAGQPGHVILSRFVDEGDLVALRANIGGRARVVLLQPLRIADTADPRRIESMQAAVTEAARNRRSGALEVDLVPVSE